MHVGRAELGAVVPELVTHIDRIAVQVARIDEPDLLASMWGRLGALDHPDCLSGGGEFGGLVSQARASPTGQCARGDNDDDGSAGHGSPVVRRGPTSPGTTPSAMHRPALAELVVPFKLSGRVCTAPPRFPARRRGRIFSASVAACPRLYRRSANPISWPSAGFGRSSHHGTERSNPTRCRFSV